jgi:DNA-binding Lrp family transcriptional regulator
MAMDALDRALLDRFQSGLPLVSRPFATIATALGCDEETVLQRLAALRDSGAIARVGAVLAPNRVGCSTLAAMTVPPDRLDAVAALVSAFPEVNHNYQRTHRLNLWFVVTAPDRTRLDAVLRDIEASSALPVLDLPLLEEFHIDLGFPLQWG